jgi:glycosyltransferase involved in cell wall biosynthesis
LNKVTVLICAKNAESTIRNALLSAVKDNIEQKIVLVDDFSEDSTITKAEELRLKHLTIVQPKVNVEKGIGNARQTALENTSTEIGIWLDADDEFLPGRLENLHQILASQKVDLVFDGAELYCGEKKNKIRDLPIPDCMFEPNGEMNLFERNYLPGPNWQMFITEKALEVGYDTQNNIAEDHDFNLRAITKGLSFGFSEHIGYRQYSYPESFSRDLEQQLMRTRMALLKHSREDLEKLLAKKNINEQKTKWILVHFLIYRKDFQEAHDLIINNEPCKVDKSPDRQNSLEMQNEFWKDKFYQGTLQLLLGNPERAEVLLSESNSIKQTPEGANNHGVALSLTGKKDLADKSFKDAISMFPSYQDANKNLFLRDGKFPRVTTTEIRVHPSRHEYSI